MNNEDWIKYNSNICHICNENIDYERVCSNGNPLHKHCTNKIDKNPSVNWSEFYKQKNVEKSKTECKECCIQTNKLLCM